ncbi:DUF5808 domain-containing protein [Paenibacillus cremeus]|uniref:DUF5808 domain-containing protein n=1 Tax=Paenibacillus cremeus TaxID=2163881 RepID=A0A559KI05_9BACL|nr:DUF5808 domain-containing protein [Paenibacillus cremeus]TVY11763.1 hypothetical protein FPZ49_00255 [Paenibacillus cremeus]
MGEQQRNPWKWGIFYYNPDNKSIFVPKRLGLGWTVNFAHPASWLVILVIVAAIVVVKAVGK